MGFEGLDFLIAAFLSTCCTVIIGGIFALLAWVRAFDVVPEEGARRASIAVWAMTLSVVSDLIVFPVLMLIPFGEDSLKQTTWMVFLLASLAFQILCAATAHLESPSVTKILRIGSALTLAGNALCLILYILTQPGMPLH